MSDSELELSFSIRDHNAPSLEALVDAVNGRRARDTGPLVSTAKSIPWRPLAKKLVLPDSSQPDPDLARITFNCLGDWLLFVDRNVLGCNWGGAESVFVPVPLEQLLKLQGNGNVLERRMFAHLNDIGNYLRNMESLLETLSTELKGSIETSLRDALDSLDRYYSGLDVPGRVTTFLLGQHYPFKKNWVKPEGNTSSSTTDIGIDATVQMLFAIINAAVELKR